MPIIITFEPDAAKAVNAFAVVGDPPEAILTLRREGVKFTLYREDRVGIPNHLFERAKIALAQAGITI
jgi:hypothetical protein